MIAVKVWLLVALAWGIHGTPTTLAEMSSKEACEASLASLHQQTDGSRLKFLCVPAEVLKSIN